MKQVAQLLSENWRVAIVWECSIRLEWKLRDGLIFETLASWLKAKDSNLFEHGYGRVTKWVK